MYLPKRGLRRKFNPAEVQESEQHLKLLFLSLRDLPKPSHQADLGFLLDISQDALN